MVLSSFLLFELKRSSAYGDDVGSCWCVCVCVSSMQQQQHTIMLHKRLSRVIGMLLIVIFKNLEQSVVYNFFLNNSRSS